MILIIWLIAVSIILFLNYCAHMLAEKSNYYYQNITQS